ncbi:hypothetical protein M3M35_06865 [Fructilactobacillus myrtifloralis]|uniref:Uncharacterized protein n=1 Tax=Fructilactobacillus myrtifloralis TaxID=2940301 RepID=A0ABY5BMU6_9LACO|nr:hypothetical protein [Fructilactobacillus myrtifloralis]USS85003.1 hypothetical protein M3M35_06865 [Fructilactobacillus myrtifloralis]
MEALLDVLVESALLCIEAEVLMESLVDFAAEVLVEVLWLAELLADCESIPEPLFDTDSETLFITESLSEVEALAEVLSLTALLVEAEALADSELVEAEALSLASEVLFEALILSLAMESLIDLASESEILSIPD